MFDVYWRGGEGLVAVRMRESAFVPKLTVDLQASDSVMKETVIEVSGMRPPTT